MTSFGYQKKEGVLIGTQRERYNFRVKTDFDLTEKITIGENVYYSRTDAVGTNTSSAYSGSIINAIYMPAAASVYNDDGTYQGVVPEELAQFAGAYGDVYNPVALLLRPTTTNPTDFINANVYFKYDILDGLKFKSTYSYNYTGQRYKKSSPVSRNWAGPISTTTCTRAMRPPINGYGTTRSVTTKLSGSTI